MAYVLGLTGKGMYHTRQACRSISQSKRTAREIPETKCRDLGLRICGRCRHNHIGGGPAATRFRPGRLQRAILDLAADGRVLTARMICQELGYDAAKVPDHVWKALRRLVDCGRLRRDRHALTYRGHPIHAFQATTPGVNGRNPIEGSKVAGPGGVVR